MSSSARRCAFTRKSDRGCWNRVRGLLDVELLDQGLRVERDKPLPLIYRGRRLDCGYRLDLPVEDAIIVEVKAIERLERVHSAQLLSYLKQSNLKLGLLINFNVKWLQDGIKRVVSAFPE